MRLKPTSILLGAFIILTACGKKAPPIPPERLAPREVRGLAALNTADGIRVSWYAPRRKVNNEPVETLTHFAVLRAQGRSRETCLLPGNPFVNFATVQVADFAAEKDTVFSYVDHDVKPGRWYAYRVVAYDGNGNVSDAPANDPLVERGVPPPAAPAPVTGAGDNFVTLRMPAFPRGVVGWLVYRGDTDTALPSVPLFPDAVTGPEYADVGLSNGRAYRYAASWVGIYDSFPIEGRLSPWVTAAARDLMPPTVPSSMVGVAIDNGVDLRWERVEEPGVRYYIYRRPNKEPGFERITPNALSDNTYVDHPPRGSYVYSVTAIDDAGNESSRGPETRVIVR